MPGPLKNGRREQMIHNVMKGMNLTDAHEAAGYRRNKRTASIVWKQPEVQARHAELQERAAEKAVVTVQDIARQLDEDRDFCREHIQGGAAVSATMGKAKVLGLIIDKKVLSMKRVEDMTEAELLALLGEVA